MQPAPVPSRRDPSFAEPKLCVKLIPALSLASSKRMADLAAACASLPAGAGEGAVCAAASEPTNSQKRRERRSISVASLVHLRRGSGEIYGRGSAQQNLGNSIFGRAFGAGVASHAIALLARTNPEPAVLLAEDFALRVEKHKSNGAIGRRLHEK